MVYIDESVSSKQMIRIYHHLGHRFPLHANASGKIFLSQFSKGELASYCRHHRLERYTPKTISSQENLSRELERTRRRGYSLNNEENMMGMRCFAVPIYNDKGRIVASVSISGFAMPTRRRARDRRRFSSPPPPRRGCQTAAGRWRR